MPPPLPAAASVEVAVLVVIVLRARRRGDVALLRGAHVCGEEGGGLRRGDLALLGLVSGDEARLQPSAKAIVGNGAKSSAFS